MPGRKEDRGFLQFGRSLWDPSSKNPWHSLAAEIARALYGPCRREVLLSNRKIADIVVWQPTPKLDERHRIVRASRIIEVKLGHRDSWPKEIKKYRNHCRWLELWCLHTRNLERGRHKAQPGTVIVRGPYELLAMLLSKGRAARPNGPKANYSERLRLAKKLLDMKWRSHWSIDDLAIVPLKLLQSRLAALSCQTVEGSGRGIPACIED